MKEVFCRPKWYGINFPNLPETKYKAVQIVKDSVEAGEVFIQKYLNGLPDDFVWKIITHREPVYRSNEDLMNEFDIV